MFFAKRGLTKSLKSAIITIEKEVMIMRTNVAMTCAFCGKFHFVEVDFEQLEAWQNGELIQNAMPDLTCT